MELRHLRYFVAVAEELNFSRAAERLHMAQPPLSVAIRQLEQELETQLLRRTTRDVTLTDAGRTFLDGARTILSQLDRSIDEARRASSGKVGQLRVAFSWGTRFSTLPTLGRAFRASNPEVDLSTHEMSNARIPDALSSGNVDLAIALCPEIRHGLRYETIRSETIVALVPVDHRLAGENSIELCSLAGDGFVFCERESAPRLYEILAGVCRQAGFEPQVRGETFHTSWELGVLADVPVVALVPKSLTQNVPRGMVALQLKEPAMPLDTAILSREGDVSQTSAAFKDIALRTFSAERAQVSRSYTGSV